MPKSLLVAACLTWFAASLPALDNGLAKTPPMGWNSWNKIGCNVNEDAVKKAADAMVSSGMKDAGYQYIVIDDCWQVSRDADGNIVADAKKFPSGIKALADYVHGRGLKFGIYSDAGTKTCAGRPASRGYEFQDARTYAKWGVDYLKYDWCNTGKENAEAAYSTMRDALAATGRPIVFSMCEWGTAKPWTWAAPVGNLWRTTTDILDRWEGKGKDYGAGAITIVDMNAGLADYAGPGHWNDPDMLEVGNGGMTPTEYRSHFSLWAIMAAPLMAGNDLDAMKPETGEILMNKEAIAIDQDPLGKQGKRVRHANDQDIFVKPLADGGVAVTMTNRGKDTQTITLNWADAGLPAGKSVAIRDLWQHKDLGTFKDSFSAPVPSHGTVMIRMK
ncbi:MAG TPA: glycoside hydrolase family 27 protein [Bryobacteraceae bacterium]|nr:glycoside hydrolase family 27 protein [Bryobacteraceae bacterium]